VTAHLRLRDSKSAPRSSSSTSRPLRLVGQRPLPPRLVSRAASVALRAPSAPPQTEGSESYLLIVLVAN